MNRQIVYNAIDCLDCGETIVSYHRHDYKTCMCRNQATVDGGLDYLRYGAVDMSKIQSVAVFADMPHSIVRLYATRGGRGKDGTEPLIYTRICDMNDDWLQAVLDYYPGGTDNYHLRIIRNEIEYRKNKK
jgi:hypothetical protein